MQVRLDDDIAAFVAERKARDGGSLSKAANAVIRERMPGVNFQPRESINTNMPKPGPSRDTPGAAADQLVRRARSPKCAHPLLRRVGNQCAACGSTLP